MSSEEECPVPPNNNVRIDFGRGVFAWTLCSLLFLLSFSLAVVLILRPVRVVEGPPQGLRPNELHEQTSNEFGPDGRLVRGMGWINDQDEVETAVQKNGIVQFAETPAGKAARGAEEDRFLWRAVRKVGKFPDNQYPNVNQLSVGCCVGCGWKHCVDVLMACQILAGTPATWKPVSVETIYGFSRVEVGKGRIKGDGSVGAWAEEGVRTYGVVAMERYDEADLTQFSPARAREFGRSGVPDGIERIAKQFPVKQCARVTTYDELVRAIAQDYPVAVCSNVGFDNRDGSTGTRDKDGFCAQRGIWPHCMAIVGVRGGPRPGAFLLNSWGNEAHGGPVWPSDAPPSGFWADAKVIDKMLRQNDSYALSNAVGFPARKPDWFALRDAEKDLVAVLVPGVFLGSRNELHAR